VAYADPNDPRRLESKLKHYYSNKQAYIDRAQQKKAELKSFVDAIKSYPCLDCGVSYPPYVMDLDHRPGEEKLMTPAMLSRNGSWKKTVAEVMKCDVVCANCHRQRTHDRLSSGSSVGQSA
jgi:NADPH-dependent glutamate synthase beta subunit-like oxidoreductase